MVSVGVAGGGRGAPRVDFHGKRPGPQSAPATTPLVKCKTALLATALAPGRRSICDRPPHAAVGSHPPPAIATAATGRGGRCHPRHDRLRGLRPVRDSRRASDLPAKERATRRSGRGGLPPWLPSSALASVETMRPESHHGGGQGERSPDPAYRWSNFQPQRVRAMILLGMSLFALTEASATSGDWSRHLAPGLSGAHRLRLPARGFQRRHLAVRGHAPGRDRCRGHPAPDCRRARAGDRAAGVASAPTRTRAGDSPTCSLCSARPAGAAPRATRTPPSSSVGASLGAGDAHTTIGALCRPDGGGALAGARTGLADGIAWRGRRPAPACLAIALITVFYQEANVVLPPD